MRGVLRASGKAVWTWPPVIAVDAGTMQIQSWEGAALSLGGTVPQGRTHDTLHSEIGHSEKVSRGLWWKKLDEEIDWAARRRDTERPAGRGVLELGRVVSCRGSDHRW